ncbi:MAG TPA: adenylosuccinate lyase [Chlamydiales bacterium]|nr:adenylosuccinate lyase [Chlamydiales bacterium]
MNENEYISPFSSRYASKEMSYLFSEEYKIITFRRLWISLAKAQMRLGLPITRIQVTQMEKHLEEIDFDRAAFYEKRFRHDVMAHIHAFGDVCPDAKPIIHLGATSCYATDNANLIQCKEALNLLFGKLVYFLKVLSRFAAKEAKTPCLSYTHFQSAQPTTIGKRVCLWLQDFLLDAFDWKRLHDTLPFLGAKGATGTQSSFLTLFQGNSSKVIKLEKMIARDFGFTNILSISGQTYSRKIDLNILNAFTSFAASAHKMGTDIRLLAHDGEILEAFERSQVGSSAMPFKRNPIYSERICGLARFVMSLSQNPAYTAATQWLERSLDDSSNRRLSIPEAFLGVDSLLNLLIHLSAKLHSVPKTALERLQRELPFLVMENILMHAVKKGGSRQDLHEKLRKISRKSLQELMKEIAGDPEFRLQEKEIKPLLSIRSLIGRAPEQVLEFLNDEVHPFVKKYTPRKVKLSRIEV